MSFSGFFDRRSLRRNLLPFHPLVWLGLTVCGLISLSLPVLAIPPDGKVVGQIKDSTGDPIPGATIELKPSLAGSIFSVVTDVSGVFSVEKLLPGRYLVKISQPGFSTRTTEVEVQPGDATRFEIVLTPGLITETVTVTAARTELVAQDTPVPVSVIDRTQLDRQPVATIGDLFRSLPGVSTASEGPFQVRPRIRGLESNRVLILVDGERLNHTRTSTSESGIEIGLVGVDQIETVEVLRGSGSVLYGTDALGGTINLITRDTLPRQISGFRFSGGINSFFSSNETGRRGTANIAGASRWFAFRVSHTQDRYENYHSGEFETATGITLPTEVLNSNYHGSNTAVLGKFFFNDRHSLKAIYDRYRAANIGVPNVAGVFTAFFPFSNREKFSLRYDGQDLTSHLAHLSARLYRQDQERNFTNRLRVPGFSQFSETLTDTESIGYDVQTNWIFGRKTALTAGSSLFRDKNQDVRTIQTSFGPITQTDTSKSVPNATFADFALFAQGRHQLSNRLSVTAGIRFDRFLIDSERTPGFDIPPFFTPSQIEDLGLTGLEDGLNLTNTAVSGDVGVVFKPVDSLSLAARVGRSFREANLFERFFTNFGSAEGFVVGNPNLQAESGINFDVSARVKTSSLSGSVTCFNNNFENFLSSRQAIDRNGNPITVSAGPGRPPISVFQSINIGEARIQGLEADFEASRAIGRGFLVPFGNLSYLRGTNKQTGNPLDFISPLRSLVGLRYHDAKDWFWAEYSTRIVTTQDRLTTSFKQGNGGNEPGFVTHDIRGGINFTREHTRTSIVLGVTNLGNRAYTEQFVFAPARGRSFTLGVNFRFF